MGKNTELSKRILRTIVVAGAMLGTPYAAHAQPKPAPSSVDADIAATKKQIASAHAAVKAAKSDADRAAAKAKLEMLQAQLGALEASAKVVALQKDIEALDKRVNAAVDAVMNAQNQADRDAAKAKLDKLRVEKAELAKKLAALLPSGCKQQLTDRKWQDALDCSVELAKTDASAGASIKTKATAEQKAEIASRGLADAIAAKDLGKAKEELDKIAMDSTYRVDAQAKYDAAVKAQKRPRTDNDRPVGRGFVLS